jgi:hypothetical protein
MRGAKLCVTHGVICKNPIVYLTFLC